LARVTPLEFNQKHTPYVAAIGTITLYMGDAALLRRCANFSYECQSRHWNSESEEGFSPMKLTNQSETQELIHGAAYIRFSSEMQSDSFSLDAQLRQIKEQAQRDGVEIVKVYADPAQSAYRKRFRPGINAMRDGARRGEFKVLYVHKVDRLARRLEWALEIVHELQALDINFKAVEQPFDLSTPEGKLLFHFLSSLSEFYSDTVSKETNKGKLERSRQGYHNGAVPWGYTSQLIGSRKVGVPDPEKAPVVVEMFERYATGAYSDVQIAEWLNAQGCHTSRDHPFGKDTVRDMLCNTYYMGKIRYRGMSVRPKAVSFRSTFPIVSDGQHKALVSEELWKRCRAVRARRWVAAGPMMKTARINLLQGLVVCSSCGRRLRIQTPKNGPTYYREDSHQRGYSDCQNARRSVRADAIDVQIAEWLRAIRLRENWEQLIPDSLNKQRGHADPAKQGREIKAKLRLERQNFESGLYDGEEQIYWQKIISLNEQLVSIEYITKNAIEKATSILLELPKNWEYMTKVERKDKVHLILQEVGVDLTAQQILWIKVRPDFEPILSLVEGLHVDAAKRYWKD
jgi:DNA invertase Pin-like site-specific DNA recombinase